jgi:hypothetical protein
MLDYNLFFTPDGSSPCCSDPLSRLSALHGLRLQVILLRLSPRIALLTSRGSSRPSNKRTRPRPDSKVSEHSAKLYIWR